jgi:hypothetical protein
MISDQACLISQKSLRALGTLLVLVAFFQAAGQTAHSNSPKRDRYIRHVVQPHQTYDLIARVYGVTGRNLAAFNNLEYHKDEVLAKYLTIPVKRSNNTVAEKRSNNVEQKVKGKLETSVVFKNRIRRTANDYFPVSLENELISPSGRRPIQTSLPVASRRDTIGFTPLISRNASTVSPASISTIKQVFLQHKQIGTVPPSHPITVRSVAFPSPTNNHTSSVISTTYKVTTKAKLSSSGNRRSKPKTRVEKVYMLVRTQIIITLSLVALIFSCMVTRNRREIRTAKSEQFLRSMLIDNVTSHPVFLDDPSRQFHVSELWKKQLKKRTTRTFIIDEIITGRKNIKGKIGENFLKLYVGLKLDEESFSKLKSKQWNQVAQGIQELALMEQHHRMSDIFREINSKNEYVRAEAQSALVYLSGFRGLWFLKVLSHPISEWQQMRLINMLSSFPVSNIPDLHILLSSSNQSLVIFTLKLISAFQQRGMHNEVIRCLGTKNELVNFHAINCLKEIYNASTAKTLAERFPFESRRNKFAIVKVVGEIGDESQIDFLLRVLALSDNAFKMCAATALTGMGNKGSYLLEKYCNSKGDPYSQIFRHIKSAV